MEATVTDSDGNEVTASINVTVPGPDVDFIEAQCLAGLVQDNRHALFGSHLAQ